ncbi:hypothetical protein K7W42_12955 [Deinococcus sp. HMF7604]|uniref:hypothetical protein n=1 Tax=Deinococcus betulae TaxID=2873312 RepID=UPI001CCFA43B|nr:hypothetical protein [Deinococcus betulae]MBZ9751766.1 hypothetical protein [Deinococcus betulae]
MCVTECGPPMFEDEDLDHPEFGRPDRAPPAEWGSFWSLRLKPQRIRAVANYLALLEKTCIRFLDAFGPDLWLLELNSGARYQLHVENLQLGSADGTEPERSGRVSVEPAGMAEDLLPEYLHRRVQDADALLVIAARDKLETRGVDRIFIDALPLAQIEASLIERHLALLQSCRSWCTTEFEGYFELWVAESKSPG